MPAGLPRCGRQGLDFPVATSDDDSVLGDGKLATPKVHFGLPEQVSRVRIDGHDTPPERRHHLAIGDDGAGPRRDATAGDTPGERAPRWVDGEEVSSRMEHDQAAGPGWGGAHRPAQGEAPGAAPVGDPYRLQRALLLAVEARTVDHERRNAGRPASLPPRGTSGQIQGFDAAPHWCDDESGCGRKRATRARGLQGSVPAEITRGKLETANAPPVLAHDDRVSHHQWTAAPFAHVWTLATEAHEVRGLVGARAGEAAGACGPPAMEGLGQAGPQTTRAEPQATMCPAGVTAS